MKKTNLEQVQEVEQNDSLLILGSSVYDDNLKNYIKSIIQRRAYFRTLHGSLKRNTIDSLKELGYLDNNDKLINEYIDILGKESKLGSALREAINAICTTVFHDTVRQKAEIENLRSKLPANVEGSEELNKTVKKPRKKKDNGKV